MNDTLVTPRIGLFKYNAKTNHLANILNKINNSLSEYQSLQSTLQYFVPKKYAFAKCIINYFNAYTNCEN